MLKDFLRWVFVLTTITCILASQPCNQRVYSTGIVCVCNATYTDTIEEVGSLLSGQYVSYLSTKDGLRMRKTSGEFTSSKSTMDSGNTKFTFNPSMTFQKMIGFGGAITDSAAINILSLSESAQNNLLSSYFSKSGSKYNILRVPIAGTDFSTHPYTYDDKGDDHPGLTNFNLKLEDYILKIPIIKQIKEISVQELKLFGSAWSAPVHMKTNKNITGFGFLEKKYYSDWADYHIKFLKAYKDNGIPFWALTSGNEPGNAFYPQLVNFNSMGWTPWTQKEWIGYHLGPKLEQSGFHDVLLIGLDDIIIYLPLWMELIFEDENAKKYIDGIGVHWYLDTKSSISKLQDTHDEFPDKFLLYTESSEILEESGNIPFGSWTSGQKYIHSIISTVNRWVTGWIDWNLALNLEGGPNWVNGSTDCPIIVNKTSDEFYKQPMYYALAHFSAFVSPGARRMDIQPQVFGNIETTAFLNPDSSIVIILYNSGDNVESITLIDSNSLKCLNYQIEKRSFNTIIYQP